MSKKKKKIEKKTETWKIVVIFCIVAGFLLAIVLSQVITGFKSLAFRRCLNTMVATEVAMTTMDREFEFKFDPDTQSDQEILRSLVLYFEYGKDAFYKDDKGYLHHKPLDQIRQLSRVKRDDNFFPHFPRCGSHGEIDLIPVEGSPYFAVHCDTHGTIEPADSKGRYVFDGKIERLAPTMADFGLMATYSVGSPFNIGVDTVTLISTTDETPAASTHEVKGESSSPTPSDPAPEE